MAVRGGILLVLVLAVAAWTVPQSDWLLLAKQPMAWPESDFQILHAAGQGLVEGRDIHDPAVLDELGRRSGRSLTPFSASNPLAARLVSLLGPDFDAAYATWLSVNAGLIVLSVGLLLTALRREGMPLAAGLAIAAGAVLFDDATWMSLYYNQLNLLALAAIAGALVAGLRGRPGLEGVLLGVAVLAKTSPALLVVVAVLAGRWRTVIAALLTLLVLAGVSVAWSGWEVHERYVDVVLPALSYAPNLPEGMFNNSLHAWNIAPNGLLSRTGYEQGSVEGMRNLVWAVTAGVLVMLALTVRRAPVFAQYALGTCAVFLVSSVTWPHHLVLAAVPACWLVRRTWETKGGLPLALLGLAVAALVVLFLPMGALSDDITGAADSGIKAVACFALFVAAVFAARYQPPTSAPSTGRT